MSLALLILAQALPAAATAPAPCRVLLVDKVAGDPVFSDEVSPVECPDKPSEPLLGYNRRNSLAIARVPLVAGAQLGRAYLPPRAAVVAGQAVRLSVTVGHASVSRQVVALQSADRGQRFFVKAANGDIFAVPAIAADTASKRGPT
ncbi:MAG: hypothetical protein C0515_01305 [Novosphingobium sp.]|nr:hypothetical protein [Novosphingobium sp.]